MFIDENIPLYTSGWPCSWSWYLGSHEIGSGMKKRPIPDQLLNIYPSISKACCLPSPSAPVPDCINLCR
jgi:hypothetical protein